MTNNINPMLEKVSRAIGKLVEFDVKALRRLSSDPSDSAFHNMLARAAIEALMEPDEAMVRAGHDLIGRNFGPASFADCLHAYRAMLQSILNPTDGESGK